MSQNFSPFSYWLFTCCWRPLGVTLSGSYQGPREMPQTNAIYCFLISFWLEKWAKIDDSRKEKSEERRYNGRKRCPFLGNSTVIHTLTELGTNATHCANSTVLFQLGPSGRQYSSFPKNRFTLKFASSGHFGQTAKKTERNRNFNHICTKGPEWKALRPVTVILFFGKEL